ncbi:MAG: outer membrane protein transport protein [Pontiellaceae bacterium]|nr:outer membrane protein transport protein [Pontiellaceae bacterium]MBN2785715.1 outer membrane protein transport protein [Pontiellaceae bacterium]
MRRKIWRYIFLSMVLPVCAMGAGFQLYTEGSAEALGQGAAISGRDDLVSLAWYNPAGLAGAADERLMAGMTLVQLQADFSGTFGSSSMSDDWRLIPHAYYVSPVSEDLTLLVSVNAPYGLISEWPKNWIGSLAATYSDFSAIYTTPSVAYRVNDRFSFSAGFNVVYAEAELSASRDYTVLNPALPDFGLRTLTGDDVGFGYTASAHGNLGPDWSLGARFQSRVKVKLEGDVRFEALPTAYSGGAAIELPASLNLGVVNRSFDRFQLGLDLIWTEWSSYDALIFDFGPGYPLTNPEVNSKRWDDAISIRCGGDYALTDHWFLRGGYVWDQSPLNNQTRAPELPGSDRQMLTAGIGWKSAWVDLDLGYSYLWAEEARSGNEIVSSLPLLSGTYEVVTHIVALSACHAF